VSAAAAGAVNASAESALAASAYAIFLIASLLLV
jgi:hypothetical protein